MPSRRLRLPLVLTATAVTLGGVLVVAGFARSEAEPASVTTVATPLPQPSSAAPSASAPPTVAPKIGSALALTSPPPPKPTVKPFNGIHVDCKRGNDDNKGTLAKPLRTIDAATSRSLDPGAAIGLVRGCTWPTTVQLRGDGTKSKPIKLTAYGSGALPVIDGRDGGSDAVVLLSGAYQILENVRVTNARANGVQIMGANSGVRSSTVDNAGVGVQFRAPGTWADRVTVRDLNMVRNTPGGDDDYGAVGFLVESNGVDIGHSSCTNCRAPSNDYGHDGGFVEVWNYADDLDVHDNTGSNTQGILEIGADQPDSSAHNIRLRNNTFRNSHGGLVLHTDNNFAIARARIAITGNTISSTGSQDPPILDGDLSTVTFEGNTVSTASFVAHRTPAVHRCNSITLRGGAEVGYQRHSTERVGGKASC
ncbi:hypothetical protein M1L60_25770 [Actinoplanes sp. TRM 88003]|uniref:Right handed beta helix domain-containing protein n=1 Tax=Paractinoplanes aksuensis TaxID=2939490 RepID=A0ABT1DT45_9ACTN|nr:hypothetical protein [Actinoplanes aksuensis]MCO8274013.1 hypothetical protein [Actinoplanes aksuensis]